MDDWYRDPDEDEVTPWHPRRRRSLRIVTFLVIVAMVLALIIPVVLRVTRRPRPPEVPDGVVTMTSHEPHGMPLAG